MAFRLSWVAVMANLALSALAMPTSLNPSTAVLVPRGGEGEPFTCPDPSGTAAAKQKLVQFGAQSVGGSSSYTSLNDKELRLTSDLMQI